MTATTDTTSETFVDAARRDRILLDACDRSIPITVTQCSASTWTTCRGSFLQADRDAKLIHAEIPAARADGSPIQFRVHEQIGISFRNRRTKCSFTSVVVDSPEAGARAENVRITVCWPERLQEMQRRVYNRVAPPDDQSIEVVLRTINSTQGPLQGQLLDLSAGGLSVSTSSGNSDIAIGSILTCEFTPVQNGESLRVDARLRHVASVSDETRTLGLQFMGLDTSAEGQRRLARLATIVTSLQRLRTSASQRRLPTVAKRA